VTPPAVTSSPVVPSPVVAPPPASSLMVGLSPAGRALARGEDAPPTVV
jgi:hypothetical protein